LDLGLHVTEKAHPIECPHVLVDDLLADGRAGARRQRNADRLLLDALVARDLDAIDARQLVRRGRGGAEEKENAHGKRPRGRPPEHCGNVRQNGATPTRRPGDEQRRRRSYWSKPVQHNRPSLKRSVRSASAARRSLWVTRTSVMPCSAFS